MLIEQVLGDPRYREKARWFRKVIAETSGLDVAADVIERAFRGLSTTQTGHASPPAVRHWRQSRQSGEAI